MEGGGGGVRKGHDFSKHDIGQDTITRYQVYRCICSGENIFLTVFFFFFFVFLSYLAMLKSFQW